MEHMIVIPRPTSNTQRAINQRKIILPGLGPMCHKTPLLHLWTLAHAKKATCSSTQGTISNGKELR
eukprot:6545229-Prorocentrum_lima.AAC.1